MIMKKLKMYSLYTGNSQSDVFLSSWVFIWKKYPDRRAASVFIQNLFINLLIKTSLTLC